ncbi:MAG: glutaredoxin family protein [candidate division WOR-3 bacterium]|nr:glutaredoxin family protein [candidate division WOR-3 bacterium]
MSENIKKVSGKNKGKIMLYALSTCIWCRKTKNLLNELGVEYSYIDVDLLEGEEKERIKKEVEKWNPACSFPTLVINDEKCIVGFKEKEISELLK